MINERIALKMRLEQLENTEIRMLKEFRDERESIFSRLRELDEQDKNEIMLKNEKMDQIVLEKTIRSNNFYESSINPQLSNQKPKVRKGRPSRRSKTSKLSDVAILLLKEQKVPIRGTELQKKIEEKTGFKISNMTTFMKSVERVDSNIQKPTRGLYVYALNN